MASNKELQKKYRKAVRITKEQSKKEQCATCHDLDNSPEFDFDKYWPLIEHHEEHAGMKRNLLCVAIVAVAAAGWAQEPLAARSAADPRRTPAVEIFQRYKDAVVYLTGPMLGPREPAVDEFFALPRRREVTSLGSGCVIQQSGYILANAHAVERPFFHEVTLSDGRQLPAELLAVVREYDLALLKVEAGRPLTAVKLARDGDLMIGEPVIVIGNPAGTAADLHDRRGQRRRPGHAAQRAARHHPSRNDPDRRRHQPRQFRRPLVQRAGRSDRRYRLPKTGRREHRLRHSRGDHPTYPAGDARRGTPAGNHHGLAVAAERAMQRNGRRRRFARRHRRHPAERRADEARWPTAGKPARLVLRPAGPQAARIAEARFVPRRHADAHFARAGRSSEAGRRGDSQGQVRADGGSVGQGEGGGHVACACAAAS